MDTERDRTNRLLQQLGKQERELKEMKESKSTLRKRIGELQSELNKYKTLLDYMPQYVSYKDREGTYISCNNSYANFFRMAPEEIAGKRDRDFYPLESARRFEELDKKVMESGRLMEVDEKFIHGGDEKIIRMMKVPIYDEQDKISGILSFSWDITKHRLTEIEVQKAREFAENIVDTIRESLLVLDDAMRIISANRSFYKTFGVTPEETEGKIIFELGNGQWDIPRLRELMEHIIPEALSMEDFEVEHDFPAIGRRIMLLNARLIYRVGNNSKTILLAIEDITKRRQAEIALKEIREEFLATLTHDMKGPLSSVLGYLQLMEKPQFGPISGQKTVFLKLIRCSINNLLSIVHNIVHSSIIETGTVGYAIECFPLDILLRELYETFESLAILGGVNLDFNCPEGTWVRADREKIRAVFSNLISNAFRYTPQRGTITVAVFPCDGHFVVRVSDTGKGIAESDHGKIFQKFNRVEGECRGTGLGLYIVKNILEGHNSPVTIESFPGKGAHFSFRLEKGIPPAIEPPRQFLVLLVSDDKGGAHLVREALLEEGYKVDFVEHIKGVLERISSSEENPNLILVYRSVADLRIEEFRELLQKNTSARNIPVILISILDLREWEGKFSAILPIPVDFQNLKEKVKKALYGYTGRQINNLGSVC